jgi:hypothetical protein
MNILSIDFINILMISGLMLILYRSRRTHQKTHVLLTEKVRK